MAINYPEVNPSGFFMQITNDDNSIKVDMEKKEEIPDFENVVGLFNLLLKIDKRVNPNIYKTNNQ